MHQESGPSNDPKPTFNKPMHKLRKRRNRPAPPHGNTNTTTNPNATTSTSPSAPSRPVAIAEPEGQPNRPLTLTDSGPPPASTSSDKYSSAPVPSLTRTPAMRRRRDARTVPRAAQDSDRWPLPSERRESEIRLGVAPQAQVVAITDRPQNGDIVHDKSRQRARSVYVEIFNPEEADTGKQAKGKR